MTIARLTPWAVNGPAASYGLTSSLAGTATNVPAGALSVTSVQAQTTTQPTVSDTAGNVYTVVKGGSKSGYLTTWIAYCLSCIANTANVVTWTAGSAVLSGAQGAVYTTSSGTWSFDKSVGGASAYATALSLSLTTAGGPGGVVYGGFGEYYTGADTWTISGLTSQASQPGSSSGNGQIGCLLADTITGSGTNAISTTVSDANGGYGGYIAGVLGSFTFGSGGTASLTANISQAPAVGASMRASQPLSASATLAESVAGSLQASQPLTASATAAPAVAGALSAAVAVACGMSIFPRVAGSLGAAQELTAQIRTQPQVAGSFTITTPGTVALGAAISILPGVAGQLSARQGFAGTVLLEPTTAATLQGSQGLSAAASLAPAALAAMSGAQSATIGPGAAPGARVALSASQQIAAALEVSPLVRAALVVTVPGQISLVGAIAVQPGAGATMSASQQLAAAPRAPGAPCVTLQAFVPLFAQGQVRPSVAGAWLPFLAMRTAAGPDLRVAGAASAWQVATGLLVVQPTIGASVAPPVLGYPIDPGFYAAMQPRNFTIAALGRIFAVAMAPRSFYILDDATMPVQTFWGVLDPAEVMTITLDGSQDVPPGVTFASVGVPIITTQSGQDATPASRFGTPLINTAPLAAEPPWIPNAVPADLGVQIPVTPGPDNVAYLIRVPCQTSSGETVVLKAILRVSSTS